MQGNQSRVPACARLFADVDRVSAYGEDGSPEPESGRFAAVTLDAGQKEKWMAEDVFLKIGDIKGESKDTKHKENRSALVVLGVAQTGR